MTYPRFRNGWADNGDLISATDRRDKCPNCGSSDYRETISLEKCNSCGLICDYWGGGTNDVYQEYMKKYHAEMDRLFEEEYKRKYGDDNYQ